MFKPKRNIVWVKNLHHGTDENTDYIDQWISIKGPFTDCSNLDCQNDDDNPKLVGAHVIKVDSDDKKWYICPLCHKCNSDDNNDPMRVYEDRLVEYNIIKDIK